MKLATKTALLIMACLFVVVLIFTGLWAFFGSLFSRYGDWDW